jgi:hypothetical protein
MLWRCEQQNPGVLLHTLPSTPRKLSAPVMSFQADFYPMAGLDDTMIWPGAMYGAGLGCDVYGNVQYAADYAMSSGFVDMGQLDAGQLNAGQFDADQLNAGQFDAGQFDAGQFSVGQFNVSTWDAWSCLTPASGCQGVQPQIEPTASASPPRGCGLAAGCVDAADGKMEERLTRLEQSFGRLQNE